VATSQEARLVLRTKRAYSARALQGREFESHHPQPTCQKREDLQWKNMEIRDGFSTTRKTITSIRQENRGRTAGFRSKNSRSRISPNGCYIEYEPKKKITGNFGF